MEGREYERELVPVPVRPIKKEQQVEQPKSLEELPDGWLEKQTQISRRWVV